MCPLVGKNRDLAKDRFLPINDPPPINYSNLLYFTFFSVKCTYYTLLGKV
jgi:hypothetical protein